MKTISIVNYGLGNIYSIQNAINFFGFESQIVQFPEDVERSTHLILPGVGAFPYAMKLLRENGLNESIKGHVKAGNPLLGICLGMQLLFEESNENGFSEGLQLLKGKSKRFNSIQDFPIPQVQWNQLIKKDNCNLMSGIKNKEYFYFVNSYCVGLDSIDNRYKVCTSKYANQEYVALVEYENIMGVQFHPEKSGESGLALINNFLRV
jgi:imidazole glycerol-phosphate synthase subunit HisH